MECTWTSTWLYFFHAQNCFKCMRIRCNYRIILSDIQIRFCMKFMRSYTFECVNMSVMSNVHGSVFLFFLSFFLLFVLASFNSVNESRNNNENKNKTLFVFLFTSWMTHLPHECIENCMPIPKKVRDFSFIHELILWRCHQLLLYRAAESHCMKWKCLPNSHALWQFQSKGFASVGILKW